MMAGFSLKQRLGTLMYDWPRFLWSLRSIRDPQRAPWLAMRNRNDVLRPGPQGVGFACEWEYTRTLHLCNVFPFTGNWLLRSALKDWPVCLRDTPVQSAIAATPEVSFIIGHRGLERMSHLLSTIKSIAGQAGVPVECIVVEQDTRPLLADKLPAWVKHIYTPVPYSGMPYCRSWAFNVGARAARGKLLILHDNDLLLPAGYAAEHLRWMNSGWQVINLKRYIFYTTQRSANEFVQSSGELQPAEIEMVLENAEGGGSVGIRRDAYFDIGGFDEDFIGWGGEDNEFWDRCGTLRLWPYGYLPLVHLWHQAQPGKRATNGNGLLTAELTVQKRDLEPGIRIKTLCQRPWGTSGPKANDPRQNPI